MQEAYENSQQNGCWLGGSSSRLRNFIPRLPGIWGVLNHQKKAKNFGAILPRKWLRGVGKHGSTRGATGHGSSSHSTFWATSTWFSGRWQLKHFWNFHPYYLGKWSNLTSIFFKWVGSTTNLFFKGEKTRWRMTLAPQNSFFKNHFGTKWTQQTSYKWN